MRPTRCHSASTPLSPLGTHPNVGFFCLTTSAFFCLATSQNASELLVEKYSGNRFEPLFLVVPADAAPQPQVGGRVGPPGNALATLGSAHIQAHQPLTPAQVGWRVGLPGNHLVPSHPGTPAPPLAHPGRRATGRQFHHVGGHRGHVLPLVGGRAQVPLSSPYLAPI